MYEQWPIVYNYFLTKHPGKLKYKISCWYFSLGYILLSVRAFHSFRRSQMKCQSVIRKLPVASQRNAAMIFKKVPKSPPGRPQLTGALSDLSKSCIYIFFPFNAGQTAI